MRKHHRRADLYSAQLVACLVRIAVSVIFALLRKTLLVTVSFQLIFGRVFIYIIYSLCMIKYELEYQRISFTLVDTIVSIGNGKCAYAAPLS